jgi:cathepsin A (carboxypeptidase C)
MLLNTGFALFVLLSVGMSPVVDGAYEPDRVLSLPGLDVQPTFNHYAGYLAASGTKNFFYWFVESERNPSTDPLVLWLNGGPGCSSLTGLLAELGPWRTKPDGSGLTWNEHRWNKIANIIFIESPQCVGYSYQETGLCATGDDETANDNFLALKSFFVKFPEYQTNEFFLTGESYAGIYVPTLASLVVDDPQFNFKGFAVGNSVTDNYVMNNGYTYFAWGRGLFGTDLWSGLLDNCCVERNASNCVFYRSNNTACRLLYTQVYNVQWSSGLNPYNVYQECYGGVPNARGVIRETPYEAEVVVPELSLRMDPEDQKAYLQFVRELSEQKNVTIRIPCSDTTDREVYLNRPDVRTALHVSSLASYWLPCSNFAYSYQYDNVRAEYSKILQRGHRILAYYGDLDMACDHLSGRFYVESLDVPVVDPFKQWYYPDNLGYNQVAGFVVQFEGMKYVAVKGAGHFVPTEQAVSAYIMFEKFLKDEPY